jgi:hypothetical protein
MAEVDDGTGLGNTGAWFAEVHGVDDRSLLLVARPGTEAAGASCEQPDDVGRGDGGQLRCRTRAGQHLGHGLGQPPGDRARIR